MKSFVIAFAIICVAFATQEEVVNQIKKIDGTPFGRTLFDTIWLQLEANEPLERLLNTLHDLEDRYVVEQKEDDAKHNDFQDACNVVSRPNDIARFDQDLAESNKKRIELEAKLEGQLYPYREIITGIVKAKEGEVRQYQKDIDELDAQRAEEAEEFEQKVREHEEATAIITEARRLFTDNLQQQSFVQKGSQKKIHPQAQITAETAVLIQKHFQAHAKRTAKFVHRKAYSKVFKALATISSKASQLADQGAVGRIVDLCDELLAKIEDSLNLERFAEDKRIEAHKKCRNLLTISLNVANTALANAQTELASVNDQIAQAETALDNTNQRIENVTGERTDRYEQCEEAARDYQEGRSARDADRQTVSDTIGLVNSQLRTLKEQLAARMAAGDSFE